MKRISLVILLSAATLAACAGDKDPQAVQAQTPKELPADVRSIEAVVKPTAAPGAAPEAAPGATAIENRLSATGEFVSPARSEVSPKIQGRVAAVYVDDGARVTRGQKLFSIESQYFRLDVQRAEADLSRARSAMSEAERDFQRKRELREKNSIPQATFDRSQAAFEQARAAHDGARSVLGIARQRLADSTVPSPITGVVAERRVDVGEFLGDGGVAYVVLQTAPLKLRFQVPEKYLARIRPGQSVTAQVDPYPGERFEGRIKTVGGVIDPATRTLFAEAEFANRDGRLRPGLFARVEANLN
jgi:membrane fusion protein (multidrug efflux system)